MTEHQIEKYETEIAKLKSDVLMMEQKLDLYSVRLGTKHPLILAGWKTIQRDLDRIWELEQAIKVFFDTGLIIE